MIFTKRGLGYFVSHGAKTAIGDIRREEFFNEVVPGLFSAMKTLGIGIDEVVARFHENSSSLSIKK